VSDYNLQKSFQPSSPLFDHAVIEAIEIYLARERWDADTR
jgi:hypothetical protein